MNKKLKFSIVCVFVFIFAMSAFAQSKILRTPDERFQNLPDYDFKPHYVEIEKGLRMHYVEEGKKNKPTVVLLHGQPSWSYLYRKMIPVLAKENHVVAPDMIGFGRSDKYAARSDYTYANHVEWMTAFFKKMKLKNATLVVHDWGGLIGLRVLANHPEWFSRLVVLNTSFNIGEDYAEFTERYKEGLKRWEDHLATAKDIKFGPAVQANVLRQLTPAELVAYDAPFGDDALTQGAREMTFLIPLKPDRPGIVENIAAEKILRQWRKPVFIAFSEDSERVHPKQLERFKDIFANSALWAVVSVPESKHFLQEDKGVEVAQMINDFIAGRKPPMAMNDEKSSEKTSEQTKNSGGLQVGDPLKHGLTAANIAYLRKTLQKGIDDGTVPGASLLVAHKGEIIFKEAFGKFEIDKPYYIASNTKSIATAAVLTVVDEGKLNLDDKISKFLPEFKGTKVENATVRQLLSHTSGIKGAYHGGRPTSGTLADFSRMIAVKGNLVSPGEFFYSGVGMDIAARVAEAASGKTFEEILQNRILKPLGMKNTSFRLAADPKSVKAGEGRYVSAGGGLDSTLNDLAVFFQMLANGGTYNETRTLSEKSVKEMHSKQTNSSGGEFVFGEGYGLGLALNRYDSKGSPLTYGHSGAFGTRAWVDVDRDLVVVALTQIPLKESGQFLGLIQTKLREIIPAAK